MKRAKTKQQTRRGLRSHGPQRDLVLARGRSQDRGPGGTALVRGVIDRGRNAIDRVQGARAPDVLEVDGVEVDAAEVNGAEIDEAEVDGAKIGGAEVVEGRAEVRVSEARVEDVSEAVADSRLVFNFTFR